MSAGLKPNKTCVLFLLFLCATALAGDAPVAELSRETNKIENLKHFLLENL